MVLGVLAGLAIMSIPDVCVGAAALAGDAVEAVGRRLAVGILSEASNQASGMLKSFAAPAWFSGAASQRPDPSAIGDKATEILRSTLSDLDVTLIDREELVLLRKVAVAADNKDPDQELWLKKLAEFYRKKEQASDDLKGSSSSPQVRPA
ncbi:hypothetical protein [Asaia sp. VD9]|uniref:hypothetical protein n=1 Tax=Asaia sp. VD9 TaxID=3081235 RepID=UPI00301840F2